MVSPQLGKFYLTRSGEVEQVVGGASDRLDVPPVFLLKSGGLVRFDGRGYASSEADLLHHVGFSYTCPPIPDRGADWEAWFDDLGADSSPYGRGRTLEEAFRDLADSYEDYEVECEVCHRLVDSVSRPSGACSLCVTLSDSDTALLEHLEAYLVMRREFWDMFGF